ncbi:MAG: hypothetical protein HY533_02920 [Chloroflexi bacterium]|nr:hypothetical protein [Chloroflexota bacterium]
MVTHCPGSWGGTIAMVRSFALRKLVDLAEDEPEVGLARQQVMATV